jgi:hypothetical protein
MVLRQKGPPGEARKPIVFGKGGQRPDVFSMIVERTACDPVIQAKTAGSF